MDKSKEDIIAMRKSGLSYGEINQKTGVAKSTLSYWLRDVNVPALLKEGINSRANRKSREALIARNRNQTVLAQQRAETIRNEAVKEFGRFVNDPLFLSGVALYWAEGYKRGAFGSAWKNVDFANADPQMTKLIVRFFKKFLGVDAQKLKAQVIAHKNVNLSEAVEYWSSVTGIAGSNFTKTCCSNNINSKGKRDKKSVPYGTVHIRINDVKLFFRMIGWIDGLKQYLKV